VSPRRRALLAALMAAPICSQGQVQRGRPLEFPRDHGAHPDSRIEWWYATGWLRENDAAPLLGFQLTFFRSRTGLALGNTSRFAARQLLFAHGAITDVAAQRHLHSSRVARWSGSEDITLRARASLQDTDVMLDGWQLVRQTQAATPQYQANLAADDFSLALQLTRTQPLLLQGDAGYSRKGPQETQASHYLSEPQLNAGANLGIGGRALQAKGRAWLDHEWADELLHPDAVGWDWIGINLFDGSALTAFRLRRANGSVLWAGGSFRAPGRSPAVFAPEVVRFEAGRTWRSPSSNAQYPVEWQIETPAGRHTLRTLLDAQELDSRATTGTIYWEGLSELLDAGGIRVGLGYLEMTGYAGRLQL
jgi:predicted secreted hydrolase